LLSQQGGAAPFDVSPATVPSPAGAASLQDQFLDSLTAEVEKLTREKECCEEDLVRAEGPHRGIGSGSWPPQGEPGDDVAIRSTEPEDARGGAGKRTGNSPPLPRPCRPPAATFADVITIWESAATAAQESPFPLADKVYRALQAIAEVGREYFQAQHTGTSMGPLRQAFAKRVCFKFSNFESVTTLHQFAEARTFHHDGQRRQMQRHLTIGGGRHQPLLADLFRFR